MNRLIIYFTTLLFFTSTLQGQTDFRRAFENSDPVSVDSSLNYEEKLEVHQEFLNKVILSKDTVKQLYSNLFLLHDYINIGDFAKAKQYLLEARRIADQSKNIGWQGWVTFRSGFMQFRSGNHKEAISTMELAIPLCTTAGDSLCLGEVYEQLSAMNGVLDNYKEAEQYFKLAMPLLEKYGMPKNICTALSNRGTIVSIMGDPAKAIPIIERGFNCSKEAKEYNAYARGLNNLADAYRRLENYEKSIEVYQSAIQFNKNHSFNENRITNYMGLHYVFAGQNDYEKANEFLIKRYELKDSLTGLKVQEKIANLEIKYNYKEKELELQKSENQLLLTKNRITKLWTALAIIALLIGVGIWIFLRNKQFLKKEITQNKENLDQLTQILIRKNAGIKSLEDELNKFDLVESNKEVPDNNNKEKFLDRTILTNEDWHAFKISFNKTHQGYILRLRETFADLSEAEERLFLMLKLNLTRNEIAVILGITPDSVKKTRQRLRKRLDLNKIDSLDEFIKRF